MTTTITNIPPFRKSRHYKQWNDYEVSTLKNLFLAGNSPRQIAKIMRRTTSGINTKMSRLRLVYLENEQEHMYKIADLARMLNVHPKQMYVYAQKIGVVPYGRQKYITKRKLQEWLMNGYADWFLKRQPPVHPDMIPLLQEVSEECQKAKWMVTRSETIQALGIANSTLSYHIYDRDFPKPVVLPDNTSVFLRIDVEDWAQKHGRACVWS